MERIHARYNLGLDTPWYVLTEITSHIYREGYTCMFGMHIIDRLPTIGHSKVQSYVDSFGRDDDGQTHSPGTMQTSSTNHQME